MRNSHKHIISTIFLIVISACTLLFGLSTMTSAMAATKPKAKPKPAITLNVQHGPLGVLLTISGKNFHTGLVRVSYRDAQNNVGSFSGPGESNIQVGQNGIFAATNEQLPTSGPTGAWKIVAVDSTGTTVTATYQVLSVPGQSAGVPALLVNPTSGKPGDLIAFTGSNWLPQGTSVKLQLSGSAEPLINTPIISDKSGTIMGAFRLPQTFMPGQTTASIVATDATGALQAQIQMSVLLPTPTPVATLPPTPTPVAHVPTQNVPTNTTTPTNHTSNMLALALLFAGGILSIVALLSVLLLMPKGRRKKAKERYIVTPHHIYRIDDNREIDANQATMPTMPIVPIIPVHMPSTPPIPTHDYFNQATQPYQMHMENAEISEQNTAEWTV